MATATAANPAIRITADEFLKMDLGDGLLVLHPRRRNLTIDRQDDPTPVVLGETDSVETSTRFR